MSANAGTKGNGGLDAYDRLPKRIRDALKEFPENMSAEFALQALRNGTSESELIRMLESRKQRYSLFNPENVSR